MVKFYHARSHKGKGAILQAAMALAVRSGVFVNKNIIMFIVSNISVNMMNMLIFFQFPTQFFLRRPTIVSAYHLVSGESLPSTGLSQPKDSIPTYSCGSRHTVDGITSIFVGSFQVLDHIWVKITPFFRGSIRPFFEGTRITARWIRHNVQAIFSDPKFLPTDWACSQFTVILSHNFESMRSTPALSS